MSVLPAAEMSMGLGASHCAGTVSWRAQMPGFQQLERPK